MDPSRPIPEPSPSFEDVEDLRAHCDALARLAGALLRRDHDFEDARQDVLLAALERPPTPAKGLGPWFAGALRRRLLHIERTEGRRRRREESAALDRAEPTVDPQRALERHEARKRLMAAIDTLAEPYRTVVVLRHLEGVEPRRIAEQLDRPLSTVHTQLARALARLREVLEERERRAGRDWRATLLLVGSPWRPGPAPAASAVGAAWVALFCVVLGVAAVAARVLTRPEASATPSPPPREVAVAEPAEARGAGRAVEGARIASEPEPTPSLAERAAPVAAVDPRIRVLDSRDRSPIEGATVGRANGTSATPPSGSDGWVRLPPGTGEGDALVVDAPGHVRRLWSAGPDADGSDLLLRPAARLEVRGATRSVVWPADGSVYTFPPTLLPADEDGTLSIELAPGRYRVASQTASDGGRSTTQDGAVVDLVEGDTLTWNAGDTAEGGVLVHVLGERPGDLFVSLIVGEERLVVDAKPLDPEGHARFASVAPGNQRIALATPRGVLLEREFTAERGVESSVRIDLPAGGLDVRATGVGAGQVAPSMVVVGPEGAASHVRTFPGTAASLRGLEPGAYDVWLVTSESLVRTTVAVEERITRAEIDARALEDGRLVYAGAPPLDRHEVVLVTPDGARLPVVLGVTSGSLSILDPDLAARVSSDAHETSVVALPAGDYVVECTVDGEVRTPQRVRVTPGELAFVEPGAPVPASTVELRLGGAPAAGVPVLLEGHAPGAGPDARERGAVWILEGVTDADGRIELPLGAGEWCIEAAGVGLWTREVAELPTVLVLEP